MLAKQNENGWTKIVSDRVPYIATFFRHAPIVVTLVFLVSGCAFRRFSIEEIENPTPRPTPSIEFHSFFDRDNSRELVASLGDNMFVFTTYALGPESLGVVAPVQLKPFPPADHWQKTHIFKGHAVYTAGDYYNGSIGFMVGPEDMLDRGCYVIQIRGTKTGRTWLLSGVGKAFVQKKLDEEIWGLRYGGRHGDLSEFQIVDRLNPTVVQVLQNLSIKDTDLRAGFLVKGVLIRVIGEETRGVIRYVVSDPARK